MENENKMIIPQG